MIHLVGWDVDEKIDIALEEMHIYEKGSISRAIAEDCHICYLTAA